MSIGRTRLRTPIILALSCVIALSGLVGCSGSDDKAMVEAAGDFIVAMVSNDGATVVALIPSTVADEHPEYHDAQPPTDATEFMQEWDGDSLVISVTGEQGGEVYRLQTSQDDDGVVTVVAGAEEIELAMEEHYGDWVVTKMGDEPVAAVLDAILLTTGEDFQTEMDAETDELYCHSEQAIWATAAAVIALEGTEALDDPSAYVPDLIEELTYCPSPESQYSEQNSTNGYLDGVGPDGSIAPCSIHGAPEFE